MARSPEPRENLPTAWSRFVSFPGELEVFDADGNVKTARSKARAEDYLRAQGWTEREIAHAVGGSVPRHDGRLARGTRQMRAQWRVRRS